MKIVSPRNEQLVAPLGGAVSLFGGPKLSCYAIGHKYFLQYSTFASWRPQNRTWGRQTSSLPRGAI